MAELILFVLPLGVAGLPARQRLKISLLMSGFEVVMPVIGLLLGRGLGSTIGGAADYLDVAVLLALGGYLLVSGEDDEKEKVAGLVANRGVALLALGLSISLDELAMGFTIGLLHLSLAIAIALIGAQAFLFAQLGLRLGARIGEAIREGAEKLAAAALIRLGLLILVEELTA